MESLKSKVITCKNEKYALTLVFNKYLRKDLVLKTSNFIMVWKTDDSWGYKFKLDSKPYRLAFCYLDNELCPSFKYSEYASCINLARELDLRIIYEGHFFKKELSDIMKVPSRKNLSSDMIVFKETEQIHVKVKADSNIDEVELCKYKGKWQTVKTCIICLERMTHSFYSSECCVDSDFHIACLIQTIRAGNTMCPLCKDPEWSNNATWLTQMLRITN